MATSLMGLWATGLGLHLDDIPTLEEQVDFLDDVSAIMGGDKVAQIERALEEHRTGTLGSEDTLTRLVCILRERPHLLCGLSMWIPEHKVRTSSAASYLEVRAGVRDTLRRHTSNDNSVKKGPLSAASEDEDDE